MFTIPCVMVVRRHTPFRAFGRLRLAGLRPVWRCVAVTQPRLQGCYWSYGGNDLPSFADGQGMQGQKRASRSRSRRLDVNWQLLLIGRRPFHAEAGRCSIWYPVLENRPAQKSTLLLTDIYAYNILYNFLFGKKK